MQVRAIPNRRHDVHSAADPPSLITFYSGIVWFSEPPAAGTQTVGSISIRSASGDVRSLSPSQPIRLFLPDSRSYRPGAEVVASAIASPAGLQSDGKYQDWIVYPPVAAIETDPAGSENAWVALTLQAQGLVYGVAYSVTIQCPVGDVVDTA